MRRAIHVHLHRTGDGQPSMADLYRDLAERMWNALQEFKLHGHVTRDDLQGHAFHGNQWTGGINGPHKEKPTKEHLAAHKGGFSKMHALLSSGHKFSKQEMIDLAGLAGEKKLTDYLAMLKNPKYAGSKGALKIEKDKDGMYFVAMPDGTPAPPIDDGIIEGNDLTEHMHGHDPAEDLNAALHAHLIEPPKKTTLPPHLEKVIAKQPSHTVNEVHVPGFTDPPAPAPAAPPAPALTGLSALTAAHPGSMPKEQADKHYQEAVDHAYADLAQMAKAGIGGPLLQETVLKFKNAKAAGMAGWATAVHGHEYAPKPQQVYKADVQLAEDAKVFSKAAALNNWKANTAAEKHGNFPPKPVTAPVTKATTHTPAAPAADMGHAAPVTPVDYHDLVPASFVPIGEDDITKGTFGKGIGSFKSALSSQSSENAQKNKSSIENDLRERLKDKPNFQALTKRLGLAKEGMGSLEARLISAWAGSSGDHHDVSVALQLAVRDAFGIPDGHIEKKALSSLQAHAHKEESVIASGIHSLNMNMKKLEPHEVPTAKAALQEFVQAQYHATQELLKAQGRDHVYLARGMKVHTSHNAADGPAALKLQPASSFSTNYGTAKSFAGGGTVFITKVPRQQVLSTYVTGFGCTGEHEVVVLAHEKMKAYAVTSSAATGHLAAQEHVANKIKASKPISQTMGLEAHVQSVLKKSTPPAPKAPAAKPADLAAAGKAVVNAKSKAYKALKVAEATKHPAKIAHAEKAAKEAQEAVATYNAMKTYHAMTKGKK